MFNFDFLENGLEIAFVANFVYGFSRKIFLMLLSEILHNMCIATVCFSSCDVMNFEINLIFQIKPFFNMNKK